MSTFADGVFEYGGAPVGGARFSSPWATHYFVDGTTGCGNDGFDGKKPTQAFATIQAAVTAAGRGDVIYVRPLAYTSGTGFDKYTEVVTVPATTFDLSLIGVTSNIANTFGPKLYYASSYPLIVKAAGFHLINMAMFGESATGCIHFINDSNVSQYGGNGFCVYNCNIKGGKIVGDDYVDGAVIRNNVFAASTISTYPVGITLTCTASPGRRTIIEGNYFLGRDGSAPATNYITATGTLTELFITNNYFGLIPADNVYISCGASCTGLIGGNIFAHADLTSTMIVQGGLVVAGNYDTAGLSAD